MVYSFIFIHSHIVPYEQVCKMFWNIIIIFSVMKMKWLGNMHIVSITEILSYAGGGHSKYKLLYQKRNTLSN